MDVNFNSSIKRGGFGESPGIKYPSHFCLRKEQIQQKAKKKGPT